MSRETGTAAVRFGGGCCRPWRLAGVLLCLLIGVARAPAQDPGDSLPPTDTGATSTGDGLVISDKPALFITFGLSSMGPTRTSAGTWLPLTLAVQGGAVPFEGVVRTSFQQDATQVATIVTPVAATPGKISEYRVAMPLPATCGRVEFTLIDRSGRTVQTVEYTQSPSRSQLQLPPLYTGSELSALAIGAPGGPAASISVLSAAPNVQKAPAARTTLISPEKMPTTWASLDSTAMVAVEADAASRLDPRAMAALREWVSGGGRLVVLADKAGTDWRSWLPPAPYFNVVTLDPPTMGPVPTDLGEVVKTKPVGPMSVLDSFSDGQSPQVYLPPNWAGPMPGQDRAAPAKPQVSDDVADSPAFRAAERLPQRWLRLTPQGERLGWRARWTGLADQPEAMTAAPVDPGRVAGAGGLLAEGPVGFGWVAIVGIDPRKASAVVTPRTTLAVWESVISPVRAQLGGRMSAEANFNNYGYGWGYSRSDLASNIVLDELSDVPTVGHIAFVAIVVAMGALALLLGPGDAIVLGRLKLRHRSWATAILWISLAALAAYEAPLLSRRSTSVVNRATIVDAIIPPGASITPPGQPGGPTKVSLGPGAAAPLAWQTSLTGVFAGASVAATFQGERQPASYWRGTSAMAFYGQEQKLSSAEVPLVQTLPSLAGLASAGGGVVDPWGGWMPTSEGAAAAGGVPVGRIPLALWTFRTFQDRVRTLPPCDIKLRREPDGSIRVDVAGLPAAATISTACLRTGRGWGTLRFEPESGDAARVAVSSASAVDAPAPWKLADPQNPWYYYQPQGGAQRLAQNPMMAFYLPGAEDRGPAIDSLLASDQWACVYLVIENLPSDVSLSASARHRRLAVCRIVVPMPQSTPSESNEPAPVAPPEPPK